MDVMIAVFHNNLFVKTMIKSSSYKQSENIHHTLSPQKQNSPLKQDAPSFQLHKQIDQMLPPQTPNQPQLQSQELFFQASLQYVRKKKIDNYFLFSDELIGQGSFAKVYKGMNIFTNEIVAIKVIQMKHIEEKKLYGLLETEIEILKSLKHPNILRCYDILITDNNCYIVTELCQDGQLNTFINKQKKTRQNDPLLQFTLEPLIYDIYQGLLYLERKNIIHRDIKMSNILVKNDKAKIADFGLASFSNQIFKDVKVGSPIYMAPESLLKNLYGPKTDVWAFGILLFQFFHGSSPFQHCRNTQELQKQISIPFNKGRINNQVHQDAKRLICLCLTHLWHNRPTFKQLWTENYIKSLRLKIYVDKKQLNFYKEASNNNFLQQFEKNKSQDHLKIQKSLDQNFKIETNVQNINQLRSEYGYSFQDFLKTNSQFYYQEQNSLENQQIQNLMTLKTLKTLKNQNQAELILNYNGANEKAKDFEDEMQEFYRKAEKMMKRNSLQINETKLKITEGTQQCHNSSYHDGSVEKYSNEAQGITKIKSQNMNENQSSTLSQPQMIKNKELNEVVQTEKTTEKYKVEEVEEESSKRVRKIDLTKNYSHSFTSFQNTFISVQQPKLFLEFSTEDQKKLFQQNCQSNGNQIIKTSEIVECQRQKENKEKISQTHQDDVLGANNIKSKVEEILSIKQKTQDKVYLQNLKKFTNLQSTKQINSIPIFKDKYIRSEKQLIVAKKCWQIELSLVLLEFIQFIIKYFSFTDKIIQSQEEKLKSLQLVKDISRSKIKQFFYLIAQSVCQQKVGLFKQDLYTFCQQVLIKKVSQLVLTMDSEQSYELLEIVKTHKNLLNGIKLDQLMNNLHKVSTKQETNNLFERIYSQIKLIEDQLTFFSEKDANECSQKEILIARRLCWIGLWLGRIQSTFMDVERYLFGNPNRPQKPQSQNINEQIRKLEQFVLAYENVLTELKMNISNQNSSLESSKHLPSINNINVKQITTNHKLQLQQSHLRTKSDINYFFQLVYQIDLNKMNSDQN